MNANRVAPIAVKIVGMKRAERVRLYPSHSQEQRLCFMLDVTRELYNALLQERREAYRIRKKHLSSREQYAEITALRKPTEQIDTRLAAVYRECEDATLRRLDLAMQSFFRRCKSGEVPGFPRFKSRDRWHQLEFPHGDRALKLNFTQSKVAIPGVGSVKLRRGRVIPAFGRAMVVRKNGRWYACFECERGAVPTSRKAGVLGIDRGVHVLVATSEARLFKNPRFLDRLRLNVERAQRVVSKRVPKSKNRCKAVAALARLHERAANARRDHLHKVSRAIVNAAPQTIAIESLHLGAMTQSAKGTIEHPGRNVRAKAALNRALLDSSFGLLQLLIASKAEEAGVALVAVDPRYSSQECARCGYVATKSRARRRYCCVSCGFRNHADVNAALVIARRAESQPVGRGGAWAHLSDLRRMPNTGVEPATLRGAAQGIYDEGGT